MSPLRCAALVLSAGFSSRLDEFKPLLRLGDQTLLERAVRLFQAAAVDDIRVVVGHRADEVRPLVEAVGAWPVYNPKFPEGMFSSVRAGVATLGAEVEAFFVLPVDVPLVRPWTVRWLRDSLAESDAAVVYPCFDGVRGHPPLISGRCQSVIAASGGRGGLRAALEEFDPEALDVEVADRNVLFDVDGPADWKEALERWGRRGIPTRDECDALLRRVFPVGPEAVSDSLAVSRVALALGRALEEADCRLDLGLIETAALLHDIAKGRPDHAALGARLIDEWGFPEVAAVVASHVDLEGDRTDGVGVREVVYLADKLVWGDRVVSLETRFLARCAEFVDDPAAVAAVETRLGRARDVRDRIGAVLGRLPEDVVPELRRFPPSPTGCWREQLAEDF